MTYATWDTVPLSSFHFQLCALSQADLCMNYCISLYSEVISIHSFRFILKIYFLLMTKFEQIPKKF